MSDLDLDTIIKNIEEGNSIAEKELVPLLFKLKEVLYMENNVLELQSPITICGDIHGQLYDLFELFEKSLNGEPFGNQKFLFMGDYVDRGYYSVETFSYLAALKLKYPNCFYLLRGNHECRQINQMYGFYNESQLIYGHTGIWNLCNEIFDLLPMAALIDDKVFSVHGGLSPKITLIESISLLNRNYDLPSSGPLSDLCWSDPEDVQSWHENTRGAGYIFGAPQVQQFCHLNKIDFVTRSHQLVQEGYKWFFDQKLITVWSAPNYMYRAGNQASVMKYHPQESEPYEIVIFSERAPSRRKKPENTTASPYFL